MKRLLPYIIVPALSRGILRIIMFLFWNIIMGILWILIVTIFWFLTSILFLCISTLISLIITNRVFRIKKWENIILFIFSVLVITGINRAVSSYQEFEYKNTWIFQNEILNYFYNQGTQRYEYSIDTIPTVEICNKLSKFSSVYGKCKKIFAGDYNTCDYRNKPRFYEQDCQLFDVLRFSHDTTGLVNYLTKNTFNDQQDYRSIWAYNAQITKEVLATQETWTCQKMIVLNETTGTLWGWIAQGEHARKRACEQWIFTTQTCHTFVSYYDSQREREKMMKESLCSWASNWFSWLQKEDCNDILIRRYDEHKISEAQAAMANLLGGLSSRKYQEAVKEIGIDTHGNEQMAMNYAGVQPTYIINSLATFCNQAQSWRDLRFGW